MKQNDHAWLRKVWLNPLTLREVSAKPKSPAFASGFLLEKMNRIRGRAGVKQRNRIRARDCGLCQPCRRAGRLALGFEVDHVVALANGGTNDDDNLELTCAQCHRVKTAADLGYTVREGCDAAGNPSSAAHHWNL